MNIDLISREALKKNEPHYDEEGFRIFYESEIDNAPTVELDESVIQEVLNKRCMTVVANEYLVALHGKRPQGEWIMEENNKDYPDGKGTCSHCGYEMDVKRWEWLQAVRWYLKPNFCPECGADMRGKHGLVVGTTSTK